MKPLIVILTLLLAAPFAFAEEGSEFAQTVDDLTYPQALGWTAARLLSDNPQKHETGLRMTDALIINTLLTEGLESAIHSHRPAPYQDEDDGFPSGHASTAFAMAAAITEREPGAKWVAYPLAALATWARYDIRQHDWEQLVGGAILGAWVGHMCGEGKWRLLGHRDEAPVPASFTPGDYRPASGIEIWGTGFRV